MAIVVVLAILFSCILLILCLPITYALTVHIGTPFQVEGQGSWGRKLADASWSYSLGEEPHHELHTCWKRSPAVKEPVETPPPTPEEAKKAWEELEKESQHLTYEDLLREKGPEAPESTESGSPKKSRRYASSCRASSIAISWRPSSPGCPACSAMARSAALP